jgi:hypothetical protein
VEADDFEAGVWRCESFIPTHYEEKLIMIPESDGPIAPSFSILLGNMYVMICRQVSQVHSHSELYLFFFFFFFLSSTGEAVQSVSLQSLAFVAPRSSKEYIRE